PTSRSSLFGNTAVWAVGNDLDNHLVGNDLANNMVGGAGADVMYGGKGEDVYNVDDVDDLVIENANEGSDTVYASVDYILPANVEYLHLFGSAVSGTGNAENNVIFGSGLNNILDGGAGADQLIGGAGDDTFAFYRGEANGDVMVDFAGNGAALGDSLEFV